MHSSCDFNLCDFPLQGRSVYSCYTENWSYRVHKSKDEHCIAQKGTLPCQTCPGGWRIHQNAAVIVVSLFVAVSLQLGIGGSGL